MKKFFHCFLFAVMTACSSPFDKKEAAASADFISIAVQRAAIDSVKTACPEPKLHLLEKGVKTCFITLEKRRWHSRMNL